MMNCEDKNRSNSGHISRRTDIIHLSLSLRTVQTEGTDKLSLHRMNAKRLKPRLIIHSSRLGYAEDLLSLETQIFPYFHLSGFRFRKDLHLPNAIPCGRNDVTVFYNAINYWHISRISVYTAMTFSMTEFGYWCCTEFGYWLRLQSILEIIAVLQESED